ncbi:MAG: ribonuclease T2 [Campylobacterota bacterium]|nr:ribonuclease T2 [Campylobacterota bacterium]
MKKIVNVVLVLLLGAVVYAYSNFQDKEIQTSEKHRSSKVSTQNVLAISWQNAFCQTHQNRRECRNVKPSAFSATHFTLHGLWPQPKNNNYCKPTKKIYLKKPLYKKLLHVMPAAASGLHQHEWKKHGTCYGTSPEQYFEDSIALLNQINSSAVRDFFVTNIGQSVSIKQVHFAFDKAFGQGSGRKVKMKCQKGLIIELQITLGGDISNNQRIEPLLKNALKAQNGCQKGRIDRVGFH